MKKIQDGSRYFHQRDIIRPVSAGALIASILVAWFTYSWVAYVIAGIVAPISLVLFFVAGARTISDNDMSEQIAHTMQDYDKPVTDMAGFDRAVLKHPAPVETSAYDFGESAVYFKKGKNGTPVSDRYVGARFFFTKDSLMVIGRKIAVASLGTDPEAAVKDFADTYLLAGISAALEEHDTEVKLTNTGKTVSVKWCELVLKAADTGEELLRIAVKNDMDAAALCEAVNRHV